MRGVLLAVMTTGCHAVFSLEPPVRDADAIADAATDTAGGPDEDNDGIADDDDVCPNISDRQDDSDGDGVGDACDPHPNSDSERLAYFSSLHSLDEWVIEGGTWNEVLDGIAVSTQDANATATSKLATLADPALIVTARGMVRDFGAYLVTGPRYAPNIYRGLGCYVDLGTPMAAVMFDSRSTVVIPMENTVPLPSLQQPFTMRLQASSDDGPGGPVCIITDATGASMSVRPITDHTPVPSARVALYAYMAEATFTSVAVIDRR